MDSTISIDELNANKIYGEYAIFSGSTTISSDINLNSYDKIEVSAAGVANSVKIEPEQGGIFISDGAEWVCITDTDKAKKYDKTLKILAEDYPDVLADLVLRGVML